MDSHAFVEELDRSQEEILSRLGDSDPVAPGGSGEILILLKVALKNELEATELAAHWIPTTPELDVKLALARQVGDEARHYRLLEKRFRELGGDADFNPGAEGYSPLYRYLCELETSVERLAAGQFTREAIAHRRNEQFLEFLERNEDAITARLYREVIQPDEFFHHDLGRTMLLKYAETADAQESARRACRRTLELAEQMRASAIERFGLAPVPGC